MSKKSSENSGSSAVKRTKLFDIKDVGSEIENNYLNNKKPAFYDDFDNYQMETIDE